MVEVFGFGEFEGTAGAVCGADAILLAFVGFVEKKPQMGRDGKKILQEVERIRGERDWGSGIGDRGWEMIGTTRWRFDDCGFRSGRLGGTRRGDSGRD